MPDPSPQVALPNSEWLELKNTTAFPINLQNWRIGDVSGQSGALPNFTLQPDSFLIICPANALAGLSAFGTAISVTNFPSLDNDGELLFVKAANGKTIHAVSYNSSWYQNEIKKEGGWSLEMIDPRNPCSGSNNWKASMNTAGGTPGKNNSINELNNDITGPRLVRAYTSDSVTILLVFDESVDSMQGATLANYSIDGNLLFVNVITVPPLFNTVQLRTGSPLVLNTIYTITVTGITDCMNNSLSGNNKIRIGLPVDPAPGECVINEILFDPRPGASDYIEFYNNSHKIFDASKLYIANRNNSGAISSIKSLNTTPFYVFPDEYIVVTEDAASLALNYFVQYPDAVLESSSLPSFPDDEGDVIALNFQGVVVDEVKYKDDWHFKLIANTEGVALERIDPAAPSQTKTNWHSAASTAGYGTPGYKNSQYKNPLAIHATIEVVPKVFSPDNDGRDDIAMIRYQLNEPGYVANIVIYDVAGRPVCNLVRNGILGVNGYWNWDGLDDKGLKLPVGAYIIFTELFNLQGKKEKFKNVVVLARLLK